MTLFARARNITTSIRKAAQARASYGIPYTTQLREILRNRLGPTRLSVQEYYDYALFKRTDGAAHWYGGWRLRSKLPDQLNDPSWSAVSHDKLILHTTLKANAVPTPELYAFQWHRPRVVSDAPVILSRQELTAHLRTKMQYPAFCKPVRGNLGQDAYSIVRYDREADSLHFGDGTFSSPEKFAQTLDRDDAYGRLTGYGYMFQEMLGPHPKIAGVCGPRLCTVRLAMLVSDAGPEPFRAVWKIATGSSMIDNFFHGSTGNLLAGLNIQTGEVNRVVSGVGFNQTKVERHPDTGERLLGIVLPSWEETISMGVKAASIFAGCRWQSWDIAITPAGPMVLEMNHVADIDLLQHGCGQGIYDEKLEAFLYTYRRH